MNTKKYLKYSFLPLVLMLGGLAFTACTDDRSSARAASLSTKGHTTP